MKIEKLFDKIENFYKKPNDEIENKEEKRIELKKILLKKIKRTKLNIKKTNNNIQVDKLKKKLKVLKKLSKKVDS